MTVEMQNDYIYKQLIVKLIEDIPTHVLKGIFKHEVLNPEKLTYKDWQRMKEHERKIYRILLSIEQIEETVTIEID